MMIARAAQATHAPTITAEERHKVKKSAEHSKVPRMPISRMWHIDCVDLIMYMHYT